MQMKQKLLNLTLIATSLMAYLEWGHDGSEFLLTTELSIFSLLLTDPSKALHPFIVLPLLGQLLLIITLFQHKPGKMLTYTGMCCIGLLLLFICFIGFLALNIKIILSTLPFLATCVAVIVNFRRSALAANQASGQ